MLVLLIIAVISPLVFSDPLNVGTRTRNPWKKSYETFEGCGVMPGKQDIDSTITGGVPVTQDDPFPWMVYICVIKDDGSGCQQCGGSMITNRKVLTAGHCLENSTTTNTGLIIGAHDTSKSLKNFRYTFNFISRIDIYPGYKLAHGKTKLKNAPDIAVLTLEKPLRLSDKINTICLTDGLSSYVDQPAIVSGWGYDPVSNKTSEDKLMKVDINVMSNVECKKRSRPRFSFLQRFCNI